MNSSRFFFFPKAKQNQKKNPGKKKGNKLRNRIPEAKQSKANGESENVPQKPSKLKFQLPRGKKPDEKMNKVL
jgi:hypothetical protein